MTQGPAPTHSPASGAAQAASPGRTLSRRAWLTTIAAVAATSTARAATRAPRGPRLCIDTHTHFYDPFRPQGVPWPPKEDKLLYRKVLPRDFLALQHLKPITGTVVVEASPWIEDNQWILDIAEHDPFIVGFVGNLPVGTAEFPRLLHRFSSNKLLRGLRVGTSKLREFLPNPLLLQHLNLLGEKDLSLDILGGPESLTLAATIAPRVRNLRIILDHMAGARITGNKPDPAWVEGVRNAAKNPRTYMKVSGLVEATGRTDGLAPSDVSYYQPWLDVVYDEFGPSRLIYGSNWPVSERFAPCSTVQRLALDYFGSKGTSATEAVFWKAAQAAYKWLKR